MVKKTTLVATIFALLLVTAIIVPYNLAAADERGADRSKARAEHLIDAAQRAQDRLQKIVELLTEKGVQVSQEVTNALNEAAGLLDSAIKSFKAGDYASAVEQARGALDALVRARKALPDRPEPANEPPEDRVRKALERSRIFSERLDKILQKAEELGYNVTEARAHLQAGIQLLTAAEAALEHGNTTQAAHAVANARRALIEAFKVIYHQVEPERLLQAIRAMARLTQMTERVQARLSELEVPQSVMERVNAALKNAASSLSVSRESLSVLQALADELHQIMTEFIGHRSSPTHETPRLSEGLLRGLMKQVEQLQRRIQALHERGHDVSKAQEMLDDVKETLQTLMSSGKDESAGSLGQKIAEVRLRLLEVGRLLLESAEA